MFFDNFTADHFKSEASFSGFLRSNGWARIGSGVASSGYVHFAHPGVVLVFNWRIDGGKMLWLGRQLRRRSRSKPVISAVPLVYGGWLWHSNGAHFALYLVRECAGNSWGGSAAMSDCSNMRYWSPADWEFHRRDKGSYYGSSRKAAKRGLRLVAHYVEAFSGHPFWYPCQDLHGGNAIFHKRKLVLTDPIHGPFSSPRPALVKAHAARVAKWLAKPKGFTPRTSTPAVAPVAAPSSYSPWIDSVEAALNRVAADLEAEGVKVAA